MTAEELLLWKTDRLISVDFDGKLNRELPRPATEHPQHTTLAWDYRENGRYLMERPPPSGSGTHHVSLGRAIPSAAFDLTAKWIAESVAEAISGGKFTRGSVGGRSGAQRRQCLERKGEVQSYGGTECRFSQCQVFRRGKPLFSWQQPF